MYLIEEKFGAVYIVFPVFLSVLDEQGSIQRFPAVVPPRSDDPVPLLPV